MTPFLKDVQTSVQTPLTPAHNFVDVRCIATGGPDGTSPPRRLPLAGARADRQAHTDPNTPSS